MLGKGKADLNDEAEAVAPEGQEGVDLLLRGGLPFQVEGQGDGGLLQLHIQAGHRWLEAVADLQPAGGVLSLGTVPQLYQASAQGPPAWLNVNKSNDNNNDDSNKDNSLIIVIVITIISAAVIVTQ